MTASKQYDYKFTREKAEELAHKIRTYWAARVTSIPRIWVENITHPDTGKPMGGFQIRSDMINGVPQAAKPRGDIQI